jgi:hypothetical protein
MNLEGNKRKEKISRKNVRKGKNMEEKMKKIKKTKTKT